MVAESPTVAARPYTACPLALLCGKPAKVFGAEEFGALFAEVCEGGRVGGHLRVEDHDSIAKAPNVDDASDRKDAFECAAFEALRRAHQGDERTRP